MDQINSDDISVLRSVFRKYDKDNNGYLTPEEFTLFINRLGKHVKTIKKVTPETMKAFFALIDENSDGKIDFNEFCNWWNTDEDKRYGYFSEEKAKLLRKSYNLYKTFCSDENGMTIYQFGRLMDTLEIEWEEEDFDSLDQDENGLLSFEEFCRWLNWF